MSRAFASDATRWLLLLAAVLGTTTSTPAQSASTVLEIVEAAELFAPGIVSTDASDVRLTLSPDGRTAAWFTRNRVGGPGDYDIWISRRAANSAINRRLAADSTSWNTAAPAPFNSPQRDFDPAFSADGRFIYFCSSRPGGLGGDDLYRVAVTADGFGVVEHLGSNVNSSGNEWAPMLSADNGTLLFSSNGRGARRLDLFTARRLANDSFAPATPLPGAINTAADEFDATFLADDTTVVFARAPDLAVDRIVLVYSVRHNGAYDGGTVLPPVVNAEGQNTYGPMLDWSGSDRFTFSSQRPEARVGSTDLYVVRYRLGERQASAGGAP